MIAELDSYSWRRLEKIFKLSKIIAAFELYSYFEAPYILSNYTA